MELREPQTVVVPTVVPTSLHGDSETAAMHLSDPDLRQVLAAWPRLHEVIKAGILAMVKAAGGPDP